MLAALTPPQAPLFNSDRIQLVIDKAAAGAVLQAVAEEGIATRDIAGAIGGALDLPVAGIPSGSAAEHLGWLGMLFCVEVIGICGGKDCWQTLAPGPVQASEMGVVTCTADCRNHGF